MNCSNSTTPLGPVACELIPRFEAPPIRLVRYGALQKVKSKYLDGKKHWVHLIVSEGERITLPLLMYNKRIPRKLKKIYCGSK